MKTNIALLTTIVVLAATYPFTAKAGTELNDISQLDSSATLLNVSGDFTITELNSVGHALEIQAPNIILTPLGEPVFSYYSFLTRGGSYIWVNGNSRFINAGGRMGLLFAFDAPISEFGWFYENAYGSSLKAVTARFYDEFGQLLYSSSYNPTKPTPARQFIGYRSDGAAITRVELESNGPVYFWDKVGYVPVPLNEKPVAICGEDVTVEAVDASGASVQLNGTASYDPDGDALEYEWAVPVGSGAVLDDSTSATPTGQFPIGPTLVTLTVTDGNGGIDVCDVLVTVQDTTPPVLVCTTDLIALWPPNHRMEPVQITIAVTDASSPQDLTLVCYVTSSEPDDGTGDASSIGDVHGFDGHVAPVPLALTYDGANFVSTVNLRAERDGAEKGRDYSIVCEVVDGSGNAATASCVVVVPHDKRKK